ncbi:VOC family protein [Kitasatospora sp. DSM 101779]|uniref:VOC family protein n=1 Tax=Kitasatospora sp. DSM 101779 TaxID=2853165 RepID=UPI0021D9F6A4|nr:VOC family protein [Kitasatospora sp. DSM 101779]MCU7826083.1 VOC family protein [Kitasatospora sp. DSM 101779]
MTVRLYQVAVDALDPAALARFWAAVLGHRILLESAGEVVVGADEHAYPGLVFVPVAERRKGKNRLHLDLVPDDRGAEVARLLALSATPADVGQPVDAGWTVLADPEGNEFCVLDPKRSLLG